MMVQLLFRPFVPVDQLEPHFLNSTGTHVVDLLDLGGPGARLVIIKDFEFCEKYLKVVTSLSVLRTQ